MTQRSTLLDRVRQLSSDLVGEAFVADIHNMDGRGPHEVEQLRHAFALKIIDFLAAEVMGRAVSGELTQEAKS